MGQLLISVYHIWLFYPINPWKNRVASRLNMSWEIYSSSCLLRINYWYAFIMFSTCYFSCCTISVTMPAIRADDSGSEHNDPSWRKRSTRRKTSQPYPSPDSDHLSQVHTRPRQPHAEECIISSEAAISSSDSVKLTSVHPAQSKSVEPVTVQGVTLRPTVAFDTFWRFAAERQAIDDRRRAGEPAP